MTAVKDSVIYLYQRDPQEALERLNRVTGVRFSSWPQSLVAALPPAQVEISAGHDAVIEPGADTQCGPAEMISG